MISSTSSTHKLASVRARVVIVITAALAAVGAGGTRAAPSPDVEYLMDAPATMFDVGMINLQSYAEAWVHNQVRLMKVPNADKQVDLSSFDVSLDEVVATYSSDENEIQLRIKISVLGNASVDDARRALVRIYTQSLLAFQDFQLGACFQRHGRKTNDDRLRAIDYGGIGRLIAVKLTSCYWQDGIGEWQEISGRWGRGNWKLVID